MPFRDYNIANPKSLPKVEVSPNCFICNWYSRAQRQMRIIFHKRLIMFSFPLYKIAKERAKALKRDKIAA